MHVTQISRFGAPDVLEYVERPDLTPQEGEVIIRVRASGVNFADVMGRVGLYPDAPKPPFVPGYEVAGLDPDGHRVFTTTKFEGYATQVRVPGSWAIPIPENLSFEEAAAIPVNYLTAWIALMEMARIRKGDRVLVEHGAGGVGIAALQIGKQAGAEVFSITSSETKAAFLQERGATPILRGQEWPRDLDVILDPTGLSGIPRNLDHLALTGKMILYGSSEFITGYKRNMLTAAWKYLSRPRIDPVKLIYKNRGVYGLNLLHFQGDENRMTSSMNTLLQGVEAGWLRPHVGKTFPLERACDAHAYIHDRKNIGKVILTCTDS